MSQRVTPMRLTNSTAQHILSQEGMRLVRSLPIWLLLLLLLLLGSVVAEPGVRLGVEDPVARRMLAGFHALERHEQEAYRWSRPNAAIFLYGFEGDQALVQLRLVGPSQEGVTLQLASGGSEVGRIAVGSQWRLYHLLVPTRPTGETALLLQTTPYQAAGDVRELGVALSGLRSASVGATGPWFVRTIYLLSLPMLAWLLLLRLRTPRWLTLGASGTIAALVIGATLLPTAAGYWLPTLGWPWVPLLPLMLLVTRLDHGLATLHAHMTSRPVIAWGGLLIALLALLLLRLGLPPLLGMLLLGVGGWMGLALITREQGDTAEETLSLPRFLLLSLLLTLLALGLRLFNLDGQPAGLWRDEARHGLQALRIWSDPSYRPIYVVVGADLPALLFYLMAPFVGLLGPEVWSARLVSALAGALTPLALIWAASALLGRRSALVAAALLTWASWSLSMSRWAFPATLDHLLLLTATGFIWRCLPGGTSHAQRRSSWLVPGGMALAGLLGGLAVYTYHTGRMAPLALAAVVLVRLGLRPSQWRRALPGIGAALLAGILTLTPLITYLLSDLDGYNRRVGSVSLLDSESLTTRTPVGLLLENMRAYGSAYHVAGDRNGRHHMPSAPLLDPLTGLLLVLGVGLVLLQGRQRPGLIAIVAIGAIYLIPGMLSGDAPHAMRSLGTLAPACLLAGSGLIALSRAGGAWRSGLIATLLALSLAFNSWLYFGVMPTTPQVYQEFDLIQTSMGRALSAVRRSNDPALQTLQIYLPEAAYQSDSVRYLGWGVATVGVYSGAPLPSTGDALIILPAAASSAEQTRAMAALGATAVALGPTAYYPGTTAPITLAFGRGPAAERLVTTLRQGQ